MQSSASVVSITDFSRPSSSGVRPAIGGGRSQDYRSTQHGLVLRFEASATGLTHLQSAVAYGAEHAKGSGHPHPVPGHYPRRPFCCPCTQPAPPRIDAQRALARDARNLPPCTLNTISSSSSSSSRGGPAWGVGRVSGRDEGTWGRRGMPLAG